jgi:hypothetical protein
MSDTKVYQFGTEGTTSLNALLPFLQQKGIDPAYVAGLVNNSNGGGFFGNNAWEGIIALIVVAAIFGNGNGGIFGNGNNSNSAEREMLMSAIQRNGTDISQLAQSIGCSTGRIQDAIGEVSTQLCNFAGQTGLSFQQVINSIQAGNAALASQFCQCCCDLKGAIKDVAIGQERGFASVAYETQRQTCDIEKAIAGSTSAITARLDAMEKTNLLDKLDALREKNAQQAVILNNAQQTAQFAAMLAPLQADLSELKCNQVPVKKIACPETYIPVNNSINATYGLIPNYCGFGGFSGFGFPSGWNGGSLWG